MIRLAGAAATAAAGAYLAWWAASAFGDGPLFALIASWLTVSVVAVVGQALPFHLPAPFYEFRAFERSGAVYERLGVRLFKRVVRRGPLSVFSPTLRFPQQPSLPASKQLEVEMRRAEAGHVVAFFLVCLAALASAIVGWLETAAWLALLNVPLNCYPVMLQRYNRRKLHERMLILTRGSELASGSPTP